MKKVISLILLGALAVIVLAGCGADDGESVPVMSVALLTSPGASGAVDTFAGKVVSGETAQIKKDANKTVDEVLVAEGDMVQAGDVLFTYDMEAMQLSLDKLYLDLESLQNTITSSQSQIEDLEQQKAKASSDQQLSYTLEIDSRQADIREAEYNIALKEKEIESMESSMNETEVTSPIDGRVMSVSDDSSAANQDMYMYDAYSTGGDSSSAFITVVDVSTYRVEGNIDEFSRGSLYDGARVAVVSRMDPDLVWYGTVDLIDWENPVTNSNNSFYYVYSDDMTTSSKYPFYISLDSIDGMLLGEHVYITTDLGTDSRDGGLMIPGWYIVDESYVWAATARDRLEKRSVTLGDYDPDTGFYQITDGLTADDYIAFPDDTLSEGMRVVRYDEETFSGDDGYYDEVYYDDVYYDEFDEGEIYYEASGEGDEYYDGTNEYDIYDDASGEPDEAYELTDEEDIPYEIYDEVGAGYAAARPMG